MVREVISVSGGSGSAVSELKIKGKHGTAVVELLHDATGHITGVNLKRGKLETNELLQLFTASTLTISSEVANWFDRNPSPYNLVYGPAFLLAHATAVRAYATITDPSLKIMVHSCSLFIQRTTADSVGAGLGTISVIVGTTAAARCLLFNNTVGAVAQITQGPLGVLKHGETMSINTFSGDNDGTMEFAACISATVFDA